MSFDLSLNTHDCPHCGRSGDWVWSRNITHNVNEIVDQCLTAAGAPLISTSGNGYADRSWGRLVGMSGKELEPIIEKALQHTHDARCMLLPLEPPNKWGSLFAVQDVFSDLLVACKATPYATFDAHG